MTRRLLILTVAMLALLLAWHIMPGAAETAEGKKPRLPPFHITAAHMELDLGANHLEYTGNVHFTSPVNTTTITCAHLEANSASAKDVTSMQATGDVVFTMISVPAEKDKPTYHIRGDAQMMHYGMVGPDPVVRLETGKNAVGKDVAPVVVMVNKTTGEKSVMTGDQITYNLHTRKLEVKQPDINGGDEQ